MASCIYRRSDRNRNRFRAIDQAFGVWRFGDRSKAKPRILV